MKRILIPLLGLLAVVVTVSLHNRSGERIPGSNMSTASHPQPGVGPRQHRPRFHPVTFPVAVPVPEITYQRQSDQAPSWAIPYGREFWHQLGPASPSVSANVDLGDVLGRVAHAISQTPVNPQLKTKAYTATFDGSGFELELYRPLGRVSLGAVEAENQPDDPFQTAPGPTTMRFESEASAQARFRTLSVRSGSEVLYSPNQAAVSWSVLGNTAQGLLSSEHGVVEHYETGPSGVEVSWVLQQPLTATDSLEIEAELSGLIYWGQDGTGHHYTDGQGVARVYVSQAYLVDAGGTRVGVPVMAYGNLLRLSVPAETLGPLVYPVAIDPTVGTEFGVGNPTGTGEQTAPAIAAAADRGTNSSYLVTWTDTRLSTNSDIYGARVGTNGTVLDPGGIAICTAANVQANSAVGYNGTNFLVAWQDKRSGTNDIYGARVDINGVVVDTNAIAISTANKDQLSPTVANVAGQYLVAWQDNRGIYYDIYGARVSSGGSVLDTNGIAINTETNAQRLPKATSIGTNYFVAYFSAQSSAAYDIYGSRVTSTGVTLDGIGIPVCTVFNEQYYQAVAANGSNYLVVWQDQRNGGYWDIYGARVTSGGSVLDTNGIAISVTNNTQEFPATASKGLDFLVIWSDGRTSNTNKDIYASFVSSAGIVTDTNGFVVSSDANTQTLPAAASDGNQYLAVHQSNYGSGSTNRIRGNFI